MNQSVVRKWMGHAMIACLLLLSCNKKIDHNTQTWLGIRLDDNCHTEAWVSELGEITACGITGVMIELVINPDDPGPAAGYQYYLPHSLDTLVAKLNKYQIPYGIHSIMLKDSVRFSNEQLSEWFTDLSGLFLRANSYPPSWLMFSGEWTKDGWRQDALGGFIGTIRTGWKAFHGEIYFASHRGGTSAAQNNAKPSPDAKVLMVEGFLKKEDYEKIRRPRPLKKGEADSPLRIIHVAPSWAGVTQRLELGLKADPTLRPVADLFLSGAGCEFPMYPREIKKVASMLSQEE